MDQAVFRKAVNIDGVVRTIRTCRRLPIAHRRTILDFACGIGVRRPSDINAIEVGQGGGDGRYRHSRNRGRGECAIGGDRIQ
ncbi:hypothetical protein DSECCO2_453960 [anaerobic digester metagenome]